MIYISVKYLKIRDMQECITHEQHVEKEFQNGKIIFMSNFSLYNGLVFLVAS